MKIGLSDTDVCKFCGEGEDTSINLIAIKSQRRKCFGQEACRVKELISLKPFQICDAGGRTVDQLRLGELAIYHNMLLNHMSNKNVLSAIFTKPVHFLT